MLPARLPPAQSKLMNIGQPANIPATTKQLNNGMKTNVKTYMNSIFRKQVCKALFLAAGLMAVQLSSFATIYIGDDAAEGTSITAGNSTYSLATLTYAFVVNGTTYTNTSGSTQNIQLTQVNYESGTGSGSVKPFVATYTGGQTTADDSNKAKYNVLLVGDSITVTGNSGVKNVQFLSGGANPIVTLNPGDVVIAGFLASGAANIKYKSATLDAIAYYLFNGNSLPTSVPNPFTGNSSFTTFKGQVNFNVGFIMAPTGISTTTILSSPTVNPSIYGSNVVFTATVSPAPTNGELVTFMDGVNTLGTGVLASGQASFTNGTLTAGQHSITAVYGGDGYYFNSNSTALVRLILNPFAGTYYIGDDAIEQSDVTAGNSAYSGADLTYAFVQASTFSTYTNTTSSSQNVELYQVNYYAGSGSGSIAPFVATYTGGQDATDVANGNDYNVLVIGDPVNVTAGSGPSTGAFLASGTNPIVTLNPGDVLVAGFNSSGAGVVEINTLGTGLIDYIYNGNALPLSTPDTLTINSSYSLDATVKFNVGFVVSGSGTLTTMTLSSSADPSAQGTNVNFIANISPAPTNGEVVTFMDGTNTLGTVALASGQATLATGTLAVGQHHIKALYAYDGNYLACSASTTHVVTAPFSGTYYVGDDAFEGANITAGNGADSLPLITYDFVQEGAGNYSTYSNSTASLETIQLTQVNYFSGSTNGMVTPFISTYTGGQNGADVANAANYNVLLVGDPVTIPASSTNTLINEQFLASGTNPIITLNPGDVLTAGYLVSGSGAVQYNLASSGLIDYIFNGDSLPGSTPGAFTGNSSYSLDRTIKFNIGFVVVRPTLVVSPASGGQFQVSWPAANLGWLLQAQTNSLATGLRSNWVTVPGSGSVTSVNISIDPANGSVFLRLVSP